MKHNPGIGATNELSLRVSVATLVRVVFQHPLNGELMLALERKATLRGDKVEVKSQPFGGAIRILDVDAIHALIGDFHFDSERSRTEQDFRIFIRPSTWPVLREFCVQHFSLVDDPILETDPARELVEEFFVTLKINLMSGQFVSLPVATLVENEAVPTENVHARNSHTVRLYSVFEVIITDTSLTSIMMKNSKELSHQGLEQLAWTDKQYGGKGWANAVLVLPLERVCDVYQALAPEERNIPIAFENNLLDETVSAILEGVAALKYQKV